MHMGPLAPALIRVGASPGRATLDQSRSTVEAPDGPAAPGPEQRGPRVA
jgi:hypothetical protein